MISTDDVLTPEEFKNKFGTYIRDFNASDASLGDDINTTFTHSYFFEREDITLASANKEGYASCPTLCEFSLGFHLAQQVFTFWNPQYGFTFVRRDFKFVQCLYSSLCGPGYAETKLTHTVQSLKDAIDRVYEANVKPPSWSFNVNGFDQDCLRFLPIFRGYRCSCGQISSREGELKRKSKHPNCAVPTAVFYQKIRSYLGYKASSNKPKRWNRAIAFPEDYAIFERASRRIVGGEPSPAREEVDPFINSVFAKEFSRTFSMPDVTSVLGDFELRKKIQYLFKLLLTGTTFLATDTGFREQRSWLHRYLVSPEPSNNDLRFQKAFSYPINGKTLDDYSRTCSLFVTGMLKLSTLNATRLLEVLEDVRSIKLILPTKLLDASAEEKKQFNQIFLSNKEAIDALADYTWNAFAQETQPSMFEHHQRQLFTDQESFQNAMENSPDDEWLAEQILNAQASSPENEFTAGDLPIAGSIPLSRDHTVFEKNIELPGLIGFMITCSFISSSGSLELSGCQKRYRVGTHLQFAFRIILIRKQMKNSAVDFCCVAKASMQRPTTYRLLQGLRKGDLRLCLNSSSVNLKVIPNGADATVSVLRTGITVTLPMLNREFDNLLSTVDTNLSQFDKEWKAKSIYQRWSDVPRDVVGEKDEGYCWLDILKDSNIKPCLSDAITRSDNIISKRKMNQLGTMYETILLPAALGLITLSSPHWRAPSFDKLSYRNGATKVRNVFFSSKDKSLTIVTNRQKSAALKAKGYLLGKYFSKDVHGETFMQCLLTVVVDVRMSLHEGGWYDEREKDVFIPCLRASDLRSVIPKQIKTFGIKYSELRTLMACFYEMAKDTGPPPEDQASDLLFGHSSLTTENRYCSNFIDVPPILKTADYRTLKRVQKRFLSLFFGKRGPSHSSGLIEEVECHSSGDESAEEEDEPSISEDEFAVVENHMDHQPKVHVVSDSDTSSVIPNFVSEEDLEEAEEISHSFQAYAPGDYVQHPKSVYQVRRGSFAIGLENIELGLSPVCRQTPFKRCRRESDDNSWWSVDESDSIVVLSDDEVLTSEAEVPSSRNRWQQDGFGKKGGHFKDIGANFEEICLVTSDEEDDPIFSGGRLVENSSAGFSQSDYLESDAGGKRSVTEVTEIFEVRSSPPGSPKKRARQNHG